MRRPPIDRVIDGSLLPGKKGRLLDGNERSDVELALERELHVTSAC